MRVELTSRKVIGERDKLAKGSLLVILSMFVWKMPYNVTEVVQRWYSG